MDMVFHHAAHDTGNPSSPRGNPFDPFQDIDVAPDPSKDAAPVSRFREPSAKTRVDWLETPEVHIFKADMPGKGGLSLASCLNSQPRQSTHGDLESFASISSSLGCMVAWMLPISDSHGSGWYSVSGISSEDIQVEVEDGRILIISGDLVEENLGSSDKWHQHERSHGHFLRRFRLPDNANTDDVKARLENGVLKLTIPKVTVT